MTEEDRKTKDRKTFEKGRAEAGAGPSHRPENEGPDILERGGVLCML